jgi:hypothetical protein
MIRKLRKMVVVGEEEVLTELVKLCDDYKVLMWYPEEVDSNEIEEFDSFFKEPE